MRRGCFFARSAGIHYLKNNWKSLTNYAYAYRRGLRISSAPAESGMAHLVNQRMGKKQSMRWPAEGAHRLLQVRCAVLDDQLPTFFREQFPGFREDLGSLGRAMCQVPPRFVPCPDSFPALRHAACYTVSSPDGRQCHMLERQGSRCTLRVQIGHAAKRGCTRK
jgi:hypothetical protein